MPAGVLVTRPAPAPASWIVSVAVDWSSSKVSVQTRSCDIVSVSAQPALHTPAPEPAPDVRVIETLVPSA
jgi:hypothetical protein